MQAEKVAFARSQGVAMGSRHNGTVIGWTTSEASMTACREAGLVVQAGYNEVGPRGWEIRAYADPPEGEDVPAAEGMEA